MVSVPATIEHKPYLEKHLYLIEMKIVPFFKSSGFAEAEAFLRKYGALESYLSQLQVLVPTLINHKLHSEKTEINYTLSPSSKKAWIEIYTANELNVEDVKTNVEESITLVKDLYRRIKEGVSDTEVKEVASEILESDLKLEWQTLHPA